MNRIAIFIFFILLSSNLLASDRIHKTTLFSSGSSWDGSKYKEYPKGKPKITVLDVSVKPNTVLNWHLHECISTVVMKSGSVTLYIKGKDEQKTFKSGDIFNDTVNIVHRGISGKSGAQMLVFFACSKDKKMTVSE